MEISTEQRRTMIIKLIEALKQSPSFCNMPLTQIRDAVLNSEHQTFQQSKTLEEYMFYMNEKLKKVRNVMPQGYEHAQNKQSYTEPQQMNSPYEHPSMYDNRDQTMRTQMGGQKMFGYNQPGPQFNPPGPQFNQPGPQFNHQNLKTPPFNQPNGHIPQSQQSSAYMMQNMITPSPNISHAYTNPNISQQSFAGQMARNRSEFDKQMRNEFSQLQSPMINQNSSPNIMQGSPRIRPEFTQPSPNIMRQAPPQFNRNEQPQPRQAPAPMFSQGFEGVDAQRAFQNKSFIGNVNMRAFADEFSKNQKFKSTVNMYNDKSFNDDIKRQVEDSSKKKETYFNSNISEPTHSMTDMLFQEKKKRDEIPGNFSDDFFRKDQFAKEPLTKEPQFAKDSFLKDQFFKDQQFIKEQQLSKDEQTKISSIRGGFSEICSSFVSMNNSFVEKPTNSMQFEFNERKETVNVQKKPLKDVQQNTNAYQNFELKEPSQKYELNEDKRTAEDMPSSTPDKSSESMKSNEAIGKDYHEFLNSDARIGFEAPKDDLDSGEDEIPEKLINFMNENGFTLKTIANIKEWLFKLEYAYKLFSDCKKMDNQTIKLKRTIQMQMEFKEFPFLDLQYIKDVCDSYSSDFDYSVYFERAVENFQDIKKLNPEYSLEIDSDEASLSENKS